MPSSSPLGSVQHLHPSRSSACTPNLFRRCTQINQYPSLELSRTADGGWRMENMWVSVCCWRGNPVNPHLWCTLMRGMRGTVWSAVCTHASAQAVFLACPHAQLKSCTASARCRWSTRRSCLLEGPTAGVSRRASSATSAELANSFEVAAHFAWCPLLMLYDN